VEINFRVLRGGGETSAPTYLRASCRFTNDLVRFNHTSGFRAVRRAKIENGGIGEIIGTIIKIALIAAALWFAGGNKLHESIMEKQRKRNELRISPEMLR